MSDVDISPEDDLRWLSDDAEPEFDAIVRLRAYIESLRAALTASEARVKELEPAAECWDALAACARIKLMGCAGLDKDSPHYGTNFAHIGLEFWTEHEAKGDAQDLNGRDWFAKFMDKALTIYRAAGAKS